MTLTAHFIDSAGVEQATAPVTATDDTTATCSVALPEGVYDLAVTGANGTETSRLPAAITIAWPSAFDSAFDSAFHKE